MHRALAGFVSLVLAVAFCGGVVLSSLLPGFARRYYLLLPGEAFPVHPRLQVPADLEKERGKLSFTVVYERAASLPDALIEATRPGVRVVPYEEVIPVGQTEEQSSRAARRQMNESQIAAQVVALRRLGYEARFVGEGVRIVSTRPETPAAEKLRVDDVVLAQDGVRVGTTNELIEGIRRHKPGDEVDLRVRRAGEELAVRVGTIPSPQDPDIPIVGATVETEGFRADLPIDVKIESGPVVGPSAGLMFALGIYDALTPGELGGGHPIAGTGTIGVDGRVGPVEGIRQKVIGAEKGGYGLFLAPSENYEDARRAASSIKVVRVGTFDDALAALE